MSNGTPGFGGNCLTWPQQECQRQTASSSVRSRQEYQGFSQKHTTSGRRKTKRVGRPISATFQLCLHFDMSRIKGEGHAKRLAKCQIVCLGLLCLFLPDGQKGGEANSQYLKHTEYYLSIAPLHGGKAVYFVASGQFVQWIHGDIHCRMGNVLRRFLLGRFLLTNLSSTTRTVCLIRNSKGEILQFTPCPHRNKHFRLEPCIGSRSLQ